LFRRSDTLAEFVTGRPASEFVGSRYGETELPGTTLSVDALIETATKRLHIEIQTRANALEFEPRLVEYAARLNRAGLPLEHHVLVLNPHGGRLSGSYERGGLSLHYFAHHLWDLASDVLLTHPTLYPLAVLGHADSEDQRADVLELAISHANLISGTPEERARTIDIVATLAAIHLPPGRINAILERTSTMTTSLYEIYEDAVKDRYLEQGLEKGLEQGLEQGRDALLAVVKSLHGQPSDSLVAAVKSSTLPLDRLAQLVLNAKDSTELEELLRH
jgi:hypothetical protein